MSQCNGDAPAGMLPVWAAASVLGIPEQAVRRLVHTGRFSRFKRGPKLIYLREDEVLEFKRQGRTSPTKQCTHPGRTSPAKDHYANLSASLRATTLNRVISNGLILNVIKVRGAPYICFGGHWLSSVGFQPGSKVHVTIKEGTILIRPRVD